MPPKAIGPSAYANNRPETTRSSRSNSVMGSFGARPGVGRLNSGLHAVRRSDLQHNTDDVVTRRSLNATKHEKDDYKAATAVMTGAVDRLPQDKKNKLVTLMQTLKIALKNDHTVSKKQNGNKVQLSVSRAKISESLHVIFDNDNDEFINEVTDSLLLICAEDVTTSVPYVREVYGDAFKGVFKALTGYAPDEGRDENLQKINDHNTIYGIRTQLSNGIITSAAFLESLTMCCTEMRYAIIDVDRPDDLAGLSFDLMRIQTTHFKCELKHMSFKKAVLTDVSFSRDITSVDFSGAEMVGNRESTHFSREQPSPSGFHPRITIFDVKFTAVKFTDICLSRIQIFSTDAKGAQFTRTNFWDTQMRYFDITDAKLGDTKFSLPQLNATIGYSIPENFQDLGIRDMSKSEQMVFHANNLMRGSSKSAVAVRREIARSMLSKSLKGTAYVPLHANNVLIAEASQNAFIAKCKERGIKIDNEKLKVLNQRRLSSQDVVETLNQVTFADILDCCVVDLPKPTEKVKVEEWGKKLSTYRYYNETKVKALKDTEVTFGELLCCMDDPDVESKRKILQLQETLTSNVFPRAIMTEDINKIIASHLRTDGTQNVELLQQEIRQYFFGRVGKLNELIVQLRNLHGISHEELAEKDFNECVISTFIENCINQALDTITFILDEAIRSGESDDNSHTQVLQDLKKCFASYQKHINLCIKVVQQNFTKYLIADAEYKGKESEIQLLLDAHEDVQDSQDATYNATLRLQNSAVAARKRKLVQQSKEEEEVRKREEELKPFHENLTRATKEMKDSFNELQNELERFTQSNVRLRTLLVGDVDSGGERQISSEVAVTVAGISAIEYFVYRKKKDACARDDGLRSRDRGEAYVERGLVAVNKAIALYESLDQDGSLSPHVETSMEQETQQQRRSDVDVGGVNVPPPPPAAKAPPPPPPSGKAPPPPPPAAKAPLPSTSGMESRPPTGRTSQNSDRNRHNELQQVHLNVYKDLVRLRDSEMAANSVVPAGSASVANRPSVKKSSAVFKRDAINEASRNEEAALFSDPNTSAVVDPKKSLGDHLAALEKNRRILGRAIDILNDKLRISQGLAEEMGVLVNTSELQKAITEISDDLELLNHDIDLLLFQPVELLGFDAVKMTDGSSKDYTVNILARRDLTTIDDQDALFVHPSTVVQVQDGSYYAYDKNMQKFFKVPAFCAKQEFMQVVSLENRTNIEAYRTFNTNLEAFARFLDVQGDSSLSESLATTQRSRQLSVPSTDLPKIKSRLYASNYVSYLEQKLQRMKAANIRQQVNALIHDLKSQNIVKLNIRVVKDTLHVSTEEISALESVIEEFRFIAIADATKMVEASTNNKRTSRAMPTYNLVEASSDQGNNPVDNQIIVTVGDGSEAVPDKTKISLRFLDPKGVMSSVNLNPSHVRTISDYLKADTNLTLMGGIKKLFSSDTMVAKELNITHLATT